MSRRVLASLTAALVLMALNPLLARRLGGQSPVFRAGVDLVNLSVTVSDRHDVLAAGLTADDFEIIEDGVPQSIQLFGGGVLRDAELHLGLLLDVSASMERDIAFTRTAAIRFVNMLTEADDITLVDFDTEVRAARFSQREVPRLVERIRAQRTRGDTALFDAIGIYLASAAEQTGRKVMLLYTDGGETTSALRRPELMRLIKASDVTIYGLATSSAHVDPDRASLFLRELAGETGGRILFSRTLEDLAGLYDRIAAEIRARYTLGYISSNARPDGRWRKVTVRLRGAHAKSLRVRTRSGYFAPYRP